MEILVILGAAGIGYLLLKKQSPMQSAVAPVAPTTTATASAPTSDATLQAELKALQAEVAVLAKPPDPLAPKAPPIPIKSVLPNIAPPLTAEEALAEAKQSESNLNPRDFANSTWLNRVYGEIENMHTLAWVPGTGQFQWSGSFQPGQDLRLIGQGSQMALSVAGDVAIRTGSSIASAIPFIGTAVSGIVGIFSAISAHHAAAVQRDATAYNVGLSTCENYMKIIKDAVESGQSTPDEGINALDSMYQDFLTYSAPARNNHPYCNSVCEAKVVLNACVIYWKAYYSALISGGAGLGTVASAAYKAPSVPAPSRTVIYRNPVNNRF